MGVLIHLETLDLSGNELVGSIPPELGDLANLREIENNDLDSLGLSFCR